ncbi:MAG: hypothetical protein LBV06_00560 [Propionibacteriaceae bacterium]|nr:hypothetical protein [Propionibacteriaceae bacterium]
MGAPLWVLTVDVDTAAENLTNDLLSVFTQLNDLIDARAEVVRQIADAMTRADADLAKAVPS